MSRPDDDADRTLLEQSRALGDPTRHAIFTYVRDSIRPVGVAELTEHLGLNHNAIRQHLAKLRDAGLLMEERAGPSGPGRPPLRYRPSPGSVERWGGSGPFEALAAMLVEVLRGHGTPMEVGRAAGHELVAEFGDEVSAAEVLDATARRLGFEPRRVEPGGTETGETGAEVELVLDRCPFAATAAAAPEIVCDLHRGIAEGIAEAAGGPTGGGAVIVDFVVHPPDRAGCRIGVDDDAGWR